MIRNSLLLLSVFAFCMVSVISCGISRDEFHDEVDSAGACAQGDTCIIWQADIDCDCPSPVNADKVDYLEELSKEVDCDGAMYDCVFLENPRCEDNRCVAD